jgi:hypothetical protein
LANIVFARHYSNHDFSRRCSEAGAEPETKIESHYYKGIAGTGPVNSIAGL